MKKIKIVLYRWLIIIFLLVILGSTGYYIIYGGEPKYIDCVFMTVISLTSVGYGEVLNVTGNIPAQLFTMVLITFGMGVLLYGLSSLTALLVEGELSGLLRKNKMEKKIQKLSGHFIICGGGNTGAPLMNELITNNEQVVLVEQSEEVIEKLYDKNHNLLYIQGDCTDDVNLYNAGIEKAAGIIISLESDKNCLFVTMSARMINKKIRIISRMSDPKLEPKLKKAGANRVVSPNAIGALRMASEMIRPTAVSFLDKMLRTEGEDLRIHEVTISKGSKLTGKKIMESGLKSEYDLLILGAKDTGGQIIFNPSHTMILEKGMTLIVMGKVNNITNARKNV